jgi:hypothetical protein
LNFTNLYFGVVPGFNYTFFLREREVLTLKRLMVTRFFSTHPPEREYGKKKRKGVVLINVVAERVKGSLLRLKVNSRYAATHPPNVSEEGTAATRPPALPPYSPS